MYVVQISGKRQLKSAQWLFEHSYTPADCQKLEDVAGSHREELRVMRTHVEERIALVDQGMLDVKAVKRDLQ